MTLLVLPKLHCDKGSPLHHTTPHLTPGEFRFQNSKTEAGVSTGHKGQKSNLNLSALTADDLRVNEQEIGINQSKKKNEHCPCATVVAKFSIGAGFR